MLRPVSEANGRENGLLAKLPRKEYERLRPHLKPVAFAREQILFNEGDRIKYAYFPKDCLISLIGITEDFQLLEVGVVGATGLLGITAVLRANKLPYRAMVQLPGEAWRIRGDILRAEFDQGGKLQDIILRYFHTLTTQLAQSAICSRFHGIENRLSRWLLDCDYHTRKEVLSITHEVMAIMLGTSRSLVTTTISRLQREGAINAQRGQVTILNRERLKAMSCECHQVIRNEFAETLGL